MRGQSLFISSVDSPPILPSIILPISCLVPLFSLLLKLSSSIQEPIHTNPSSPLHHFVRFQVGLCPRRAQAPRDCLPPPRSAVLLISRENPSSISFATKPLLITIFFSPSRSRIVSGSDLHPLIALDTRIPGRCPFIILESSIWSPFHPTLVSCRATVELTSTSISFFS